MKPYSILVLLVWSLGTLVAKPCLTSAQPTLPTIAPDGVVPLGGVLYPMENVDVRAVTLNVAIEQGRPALGPVVSSWIVSVTYQLLNESDDPLQLRLAMVERCTGKSARPDERRVDTGDRCIVATIGDEKLTVDGRNVSGRIGLPQPDDRGVLRNFEYTRLHTFVVPFKPRQLRTVQHRYSLAGSGHEPDITELLVLMRTAALFSGPVGQTTLKVSLWDHFEEVVWHKPTGTPQKTSTDGWSTWTLSLPEGDPTEDIVVTLRGPMGVERNRAVLSYCNAPDDVLAQKGRSELREAKVILFAAYGGIPEGETADNLAKRYSWFKQDPSFEPNWFRKDHQQCLSRLTRFERISGTR